MSQSTNCALSDHIRCQSPIQCDCNCHKPSPNTNKQLEEILDKFFWGGYTMHKMSLVHGNHKVDGIQEEAMSEAKTQLEALITATKIEELKELLAVWNETRLNPATPKLALPAIKSMKIDVEQRIKALEKQ